jgi:hypothetical protein
MPRLFEVVPSGAGFVARPATISALPARVEAMGAVASIELTEEDLRQLESRLVERSHDYLRPGCKVVWRVSDDGKFAEAWQWASAPEPAPQHVRDS